MSLLGLDVGTTGCKAVIFDPSGVPLASGYREYPLVHPRPGWNELDVDTLWTAVRDVIRKVNSVPGVDPVRAMAVSCQGEAVLPMDEQGEPLYNFIITFDSRTNHLPAWWRERLDDREIFSITGMPLHPMYSINKILWFMRERPDIADRTRKFLCVQDFIGFRLTGEYAIDYSLAARTMALDVGTNRWSTSLLNLAGIDETMLSRPVPSGTVIGSVRREMLNDLGFSGPVAVAAGGHDQPCGALGAGVNSSGTAMAAMGTSEVICPVSNEPLLTSFMLRHNYSCSAHVESGRYIALAVNLNGGLLLRWYRDTLCDRESVTARKQEIDPYGLIISRASDEWKSIYVLPHLVGSGTPHFDPLSKGTIVGLTNETTKEDLTRALLVSLILETRIDLTFLIEAGFDISSLRAIGGGARSDRWLQMKADGLGIPILRIRVTEAAALGAALLAGIASGTYTSSTQAIEEAVHPERTFDPEPEQKPLYDEHFIRYQKLYPLLREFYHSGSLDD